VMALQSCNSPTNDQKQSQSTAVSEAQQQYQLYLKKN
jgi:hypothetical protein